MTYLFLIPVSLTIGLVALGAFLWNLRSGQYDDLDGAAARILAPNDAPDSPPTQSSQPAYAQERPAN